VLYFQPVLARDLEICNKSPTASQQTRENLNISSQNLNKVTIRCTAQYRDRIQKDLIVTDSAIKYLPLNDAGDNNPGT
jgi:hypothetical protein